MARISIIALSVLLLLAFAFPAGAQVLDSKALIIQELRAQIEVVKAKIVELLEQLAALQRQEAARADVFSTPLFFGMQNEDVRRLQEVLAKDPEVYPEGLVTGYFGPLTHSAVERFQEKYADEILKPVGLLGGTGFVGEKTIAKLNQIYVGFAMPSALPFIPPYTPTPPGEEPLAGEVLPEPQPLSIEEEPELPIPVPLSGGGGGVGGEGGSSPAPDITPPAAITNLSASDTTTLSTKLSWTAPGNDGNTGTAVSYKLMYSTMPHVGGIKWFKGAILVENLPLPGAAGTVQSITLSRLSAGTTYYFSIRTLDEVQNKSQRSNIVSIVTLSAADITTPSAITNFSIGNATTSSIDLFWTAPGDDGATGTATSYDVMYNTVPDVVKTSESTVVATPGNITNQNWRLVTQATGEPTPQVAGTAQTMTVSSLSPSILYYFVIRTSDEVPRWSNLSNEVSLTTASLPLDLTVPSAITNLSASIPTSSSVDLSWTAPGDDGDMGTATSYDVRYSTSYMTGDNWASATEVTGEPTPQAAGSSETFTLSGFSASTRYYFGIKASDEAPNLPGISNVVDATTTSDTISPSVITNLFASNPTYSSVDLSWTAPGDDGDMGTATSYDVRYSTSYMTGDNWASATEVTGEPTPQAAGSSETFTLSGFSASTRYYFGIKASDEAPNLPGISNVVDATTTSDTISPSVITNLFASNPTYSSVDLSWIAPSAASYDVRYSTLTITDVNWVSATQATGEPTPQAAGSFETFTVLGLSAGTVYSFALKTLDDSGTESVLSNVASGTTKACIQLASGKQIYFVSTQNQPQIMQVDLDPLDVATGSTQTVTVKIRDINNNAITAVSSTINMDNESNALSFSLTAGDDLNGTWTASWVSNDTHCSIYTVNITATSASGTSVATLAFD